MEVVVVTQPPTPIHPLAHKTHILSKKEKAKDLSSVDDVEEFVCLFTGESVFEGGEIRSVVGESSIRLDDRQRHATALGPQDLAALWWCGGVVVVWRCCCVVVGVAVVVVLVVVVVIVVV